MGNKPSIPKGTRDFSAEILEKRQHIFNTIKRIYERYGYMPIETPAMENIETLTGKYGDEGDKLLFRILDSGDFLKEIDKSMLLSGDFSKISNLISGKGLRYDLTVPFARYVVQHRNEILLPFKRYQIQPVWRADRPQKGRYREFYQCDADVIGSNSLLNETELINIIDEVFSSLNINVDIRLNNRKILMGLAEISGIESDFHSFTTIIDKLEKVGLDKVLEELLVLGINSRSLDILKEVFSFTGDNTKKLDLLNKHIGISETGSKGIEEMRTILLYNDQTKTCNPVKVDLTLARGLNYYTGTIFEVTAQDVLIGSVCGGGRYDDLTGVFGQEGLSGVGISFGADRIYDVMKELDLFPDSLSSAPKVLFINFGKDDELYSLKAVTHLRKQNIKAELFPDPLKIKKQMAYASARKIPFVVLAGEAERVSSTYSLKDMRSGEQFNVSLDELLAKINLI